MNLNIDYCIVENSLFDKSEYVVFITRKGQDFIDYNLKKDEDYEEAKKILHSIGYYEVDDLRFEYLGKGNKAFQTIKNIMEESGASYSYNLEKRMEEEINNINETMKSGFLGKLGKIFNNINSKKNKRKETGEEENKVEIINKDQDKKEIKQNNKKIQNNNVLRLNLYLFLEFTFFNEQDEEGNFFHVDLVGSFSLRQPNDGKYRHFVKIITLDFEEMKEGEKRNNSVNQNLCAYQSIKTKKEILGEISFLFDVSFDIASLDDENEDNFMFPGTEEHFYNIFEIKDYINHNSRIVFHLEEKDFDKLKKISERIGVEKKESQNSKRISKKEIAFLSEELLTHLKEEMNIAAEEEDFKTASKLKKQIEFIEDKVNSFFENSQDDREISIDEFHHIFALNPEI